MSTLPTLCITGKLERKYDLVRSANSLEEFVAEVSTSVETSLKPLIT